MNDIINLEDYFGLVRGICVRFKDRGVESDDLFQIGCVGLIKASKLYEKSRNVKFSTFAFNYISGEIKMFLRNNYTIKVSRKLKDNYNLCRKYTNEFIAEIGRSPTINELSALTGLNKYDIAECLEANSDIISLNEKTSEDSYLIDFLKDSVNANVTEKFAFEDMISALDEKSRKVLTYRIINDKTQKEVSEILNLSQVQISRIEKAAKSKLKQLILSNQI